MPRLRRPATVRSDSNRDSHPVSAAGQQVSSSGSLIVPVVLTHRGGERGDERIFDNSDFPEEDR